MRSLIILSLLLCLGSIWCDSNIHRAVAKNAESQWKRQVAEPAQPISDYESCEADRELFSDTNTGNSSSLYYHTINWRQIPLVDGTSDAGVANTWFADGAPTNVSAYLTTLPIQLPNDAGKSILLSFRHKFETERGYDGCLVYYSTNGQDWLDLGAFFVQGAYNFQMFSQNGALPAFTGTQSYFNNTIADISDLRGQSIQISFVFMTDFSLASVGWWVNNIKLYTADCPTSGVAPTRPAVDPTEPASPHTFVPGNTATSYQTDSSGLAVAALIISIVVGVICIISVIVMLSVYFDWKKKHRHDPEVPMVKISTPSSNNSSTASLNGPSSSSSNASKVNLPPNPRTTK